MLDEACGGMTKGREKEREYEGEGTVRERAVTDTSVGTDRSETK